MSADAALGGTPRDVTIRVVGSPERGRFGRSRGHVTRYCVTRAAVPVVAVPAPPWARAAMIRRFAHDLERFSR
ncbi:hypothetical protein ABZU25_00810 [Micromonospora sp. NPDC005215]|uniref:hypothetical protein n=1 Tax=Micromonospora sp. NPDC005215 TaxID=3157024 RepID=UPI0033B720B1